MKTTEVTDTFTGATETVRLTQQFLAGLPDEHTTAPGVPPAVEIVHDSAGSEPFPTRPVLPLRVSGHSLPGADSVEIESSNGGGSWASLGAIVPDAVQTFDVGMNCTALRAVAVNQFGRTPGPETAVTQ